MLLTRWSHPLIQYSSFVLIIRCSGSGGIVNWFPGFTWALALPVSVAARTSDDCAVFLVTVIENLYVSFDILVLICLKVCR